MLFLITDGFASIEKLKFHLSSWIGSHNLLLSSLKICQCFTFVSYALPSFSVKVWQHLLFPILERNDKYGNIIRSLSPRCYWGCHLCARVSNKLQRTLPGFQVQIQQNPMEKWLPSDSKFCPCKVFIKFRNFSGFHTIFNSVKNVKFRPNMIFVMKQAALLYEILDFNCLFLCF